MTVKWDEKYSVKVEKIDEQHKTFFDIINSLEEATKHENYIDDLPRIINEIVGYWSLHFATEEKLMEAVNYEHIEEHKSIHRKLEKEIRIESSRVLEKEATTRDVIWLYNYLIDWLKNHILQEDHKYIEAFKPYHDL